MEPLIGSEWWRASEYEVVGGTHIAPAEDAEIVTYDPIKDHEGTWIGKRSDEDRLPYLELLEVDFQDPESILKWCQNWGLLGILPHRTLEARFWPRWRNADRPVGGGIGVGAIGQQVVSSHLPDQAIYRQGWGLRDLEVVTYYREDVAEGSTLEEEDIKRAMERGDSTFPTLRAPSVQIRQPFDGDLAELGLAEGYAIFFPRHPGVVDWFAANRPHGTRIRSEPTSLLDSDQADEIEAQLERENYPIPYSEAFRREYGEPIRLMKRYTDHLARTIAFWENATEPESREEVEGLFRLLERPTAEFVPYPFLAALQAVRPGAALTEDESGDVWWRRLWSSPSLYASLNVMILDDYPLGSASLRRCGSRTCKKLFATTHHSKAYCSVTCRDAEEMRRYRARKKKGQEESS